MSTLADIAAALRNLADLIDALEPPATKEPLIGPEKRRLFAYPEAATYLGTSKATLRRLAVEGEIARVTLGRRVLFAQEDLDDYVDRLKRQR